MPNPFDAASRASAFNSANAEYIDQLYEAFKESPQSVSPEWRHYFYGFEHGAGDTEGEVGPTLPAGLNVALPDPLTGIGRLIMAYRLLGHLVADIDPLNLRKTERPPELRPEYYGLDPDALQQGVSVVSVDPVRARPAEELIAILDRVYCGSLASEHMHITASDERRWIEQRLESTHGDWAAQHSPGVRQGILRDLTAAEGLEQYLHRRYVGQKRFSLEGCDALIPLLDEVVQGGGRRGIADIVVGMAHRGRLNVLVNLLGKPPQELFAEFEGSVDLNDRTGSGVQVHVHLGVIQGVGQRAIDMEHVIPMAEYGVLCDGRRLCHRWPTEKSLAMPPAHVAAERNTSSVASAGILNGSKTTTAIFSGPYRSPMR